MSRVTSQERTLQSGGLWSNISHCWICGFCACFISMNARWSLWIPFQFGTFYYSVNIVFCGIVQPMSESSLELSIHLRSPIDFLLSIIATFLLYHNITQVFFFFFCTGNFKWMDILIGIITTNGPSHTAIQVNISCCHLNDEIFFFFKATDSYLCLIHFDFVRRGKLSGLHR